MTTIATIVTIASSRHSTPPTSIVILETPELGNMVCRQLSQRGLARVLINKEMEHTTIVHNVQNPLYAAKNPIHRGHKTWLWFWRTTLQAKTPTDARQVTLDEAPESSATFPPAGFEATWSSCWIASLARTTLMMNYGYRSIPINSKHTRDRNIVSIPTPDPSDLSCHLYALRAPSKPASEGTDIETRLVWNQVGSSSLQVDWYT
ncbi:hypothetical protein B0O80DRAFT_523734 [Mortierella sp. GBAus27b]|nr:hypothetical protein B0O80DRAFT_523734 [Mortierella sp. GBAus27b]